MKAPFLAIALLTAACSSAEVREIPSGPEECGLTKEEIDAAIKGHLGKIGVCRRADEKVSGKMLAHFDIGASGVVSRAGVANATFRDPELEKCLLKELSQVQFPAVRCGGTVTVDYPLVFTPK